MRQIFGEENIFFAEEKKNREGRYLEKENISFAEEKKNGEGKGGIYFEEGNIFFAEKRSRKRRQIFGEGK